jgi:anhydro-N-acetylmuramic acid kinase
MKGNISVIAFKTDIPVIGDFRAKDIAAGGQGAPLVPFADEKIFKKTVPRCIQNIGGISNVTVLSPDYPTFAFDNAPGNMLIDFYTSKFFGKPFDKDSQFAKQGHVDEKFLNALLSEKYYAKKPPKSTGRELFNDVYAEKMLEFSNGNGFDVVRTATELTARVIYESYEKFVFPKVLPEQIVLGGGGAQNPLLKERLQSYCGKIPVLTHEDFKIDNKHKEALAFAMLGLAFYLGQSGNVPSCTGALKPVVLGKIAY